MRRCYELSLALALATVAFAQAPVPVIAPGGVQNTASNVALSSIAPQMLITIRGQNLASYTQTAAGYPLPTTLGGANVSLLGGPFGSPAVQLLYASPSQINALVPGIAGTSLSVTVQTASGAFSSAPYPIPVATGDYPWPLGPLGIFTQDSSGCGQAVAYNVHADGSVSLNTPRNSLDPENDAGLTIYLTGLGSLDFPDLQDGVPWAYNSADNLAPEFGNLAAVMFGAPGLTGTAGGLTLSYLGPAPGKVGIDQANALGHWSGAPQGCKVPMSMALLFPQTASSTAAEVPSIFSPVNSSQLVDVSIQPGGGVCADPQDGGLGIVAWQKYTLSTASGVSTSESVTAQFVQANGLGFAPPSQEAALFTPLSAIAPADLGEGVYGPAAILPPACAASLPSTLDAGTLTLSGPGLNPAPMPASTQDNRLTYQAVLAPGTLQGGTYLVTGVGGSQVGAIAVNPDIPAPVTAVTNPILGGGLAPGVNLPVPCLALGFFSPCYPGYNFSWSGGDDRSTVTVQFIVNGNFQAVESASAAAGQLFLESSYGAFPQECSFFILAGDCALIPTGNVEVIVTQTPSQTPPQFSAQGLGYGIETTWKYVWDFRGLTNY